MQSWILALAPPSRAGGPFRPQVTPLSNGNSAGNSHADLTKSYTSKPFAYSLYKSKDKAQEGAFSIQ